MTHTNTNDTEASRKILEDQLRQYFYQAMCTKKIHEQCSDLLFSTWSFIQWSQITLSVLVTGGFISILFGTDQIGASIGSIISIILLLLNTYIKNFNLGGIAQQHKHTAIETWYVATKICSLISDLLMGEKPIESLQNERDNLLDKLHSAFLGAPNIAFKKYQKIIEDLKSDTVVFSDQEIDAILPEEFRKKKTK